MLIGRVIKSNSHTDYVCQIFGLGEVTEPPRPREHAFGACVRIPSDGCQMVGVIYDTLLFNPDYGTIGPRLSPDRDLRVVSPDYLTEKITLVGIVSIGSCSVDDEGCLAEPSHDLCVVAPETNAEVHTLGDRDVRAFHLPGGHFALGYISRLLASRGAYTPELVASIVQRLEPSFPEETRCLKLIVDAINWNTRIGALR